MKREKQRGEKRGAEKVSYIQPVEGVLQTEPMYRLIFVWTLLALVVFAQQGRSQDLSLGAIGLGGPGCKDQSAQVSLEASESGHEVKVQFYEYYVEKESTGLKRSACSVAIPIKVPKKHRLEVAPTTVTALVGIEEGDSVQLSGEAFLAGSRGSRSEIQFLGPKLDFESLELAQETQSACGEDVILRINTSVILRNQSALYGFALVDTLSTQIQLVACE